MSARILVVDDLLPNVKLLEAKLTQEYYEVEIANDGYQALEKLESFKPDVVLLDIMMPGMDGFETCQKIREGNVLPYVPVVMITALSERSDRINGLEAGADDFLTKPFNDIALFARIKSLVRLKTMMDELKSRNKTIDKFGGDKVDFASIDSIDGAKVLLVDDDEVTTNRIVTKLTDYNFNVDIESQGKNAETKAKQGDYDVVIVSSHLEDMEGLRVCSHLRAAKQTKDLSVILAVDDDDQATMVKALEMGVNDYILAPIDISELVVRIKTQVRRKRYQDALRKLQEDQLNLSVIDPLTGLHNRRYLDTYLPKQVKASHEQNKRISVMFLDIDDFKMVNDTYGHDVGDEIIKEFAARVKDITRPSDLVARYGGEEFIVIMPDTGFPHAHHAADRILKTISSKPFKVSTAEGELTKTLSIGLATLQDDDTPETVVKRADERVYKAKQAGKNCVKPDYDLEDTEISEFKNLKDTSREQILRAAEAEKDK